jgi:predicted phosphodiesterase
MTVIWFTSRPAVGWVEYAPADNFQTFPKFGGLVGTARSIRHGLVDADATRHMIQITGLAPGKPYRYRVVAKEVRQFEPYEVIYGDTATGDIHEFRTLDPKKSAFRFQVFQDIHGDVTQLNGLFQLAGWESSDLFFFNGDTMDSLKNEAAVFNGFLDFSVGRFAANTPFIYVRGNHDSRGAMARRMDEFFPPRDGRFYGSFDHGPVHFVVMDGGEDKPDNSPVYAGLADFDRYRQEQTEWLKTEIQTNAFQKAAFRVAIIHFPLYRKGFTPEQLTQLWGPLFNKGGLDVVLSGHEHRLYRVDPAVGKNAFPVLGAPRGALIRADVSAASLDLKVIDIKGTTLESLVLPAPKR